MKFKLKYMCVCALLLLLLHGNYTNQNKNTAWTFYFSQQNILFTIKSILIGIQYRGKYKLFARNKKGNLILIVAVVTQ